VYIYIYLFNALELIYNIALPIKLIDTNTCTDKLLYIIEGMNAVKLD